jgi:tryptophan 2,3-dioxygenase
MTGLGLLAAARGMCPMGYGHGPSPHATAYPMAAGVDAISDAMRSASDSEPGHPPLPDSNPTPVPRPLKDGGCSGSGTGACNGNEHRLRGEAQVEEVSLNKALSQKQQQVDRAAALKLPDGQETQHGKGGRAPLYYPDYLKLETLLDCQKPISFETSDPCHDELLFITIHQTYELWFKQLLFELDSVREILAELNIGEKKISLALHRLTRIREIQKLLNDQIRVLETMQPTEFLAFRDHLFPASGFQSFQFRLLEIKLGVRPEQRLNARWIRNISEHHQDILRKAQLEPSLFEYVERWLRNIPFREFRGYNFQEAYKSAVDNMFAIERGSIERTYEGPERDAALLDLQASRITFDSVYDRRIHDQMIASKARRLGFRATSASLMIMLYQDEPMLQLPARLLHMLVDVDEMLNQWRSLHASTVHRMIGRKIGTGGTLGHSYLKQTIDSHKVFSDIANLSTLLLPRRLVPNLPSGVSDQMKYFHSVDKLGDRSLFEMMGGGDSIAPDYSFC